VKVQWCWRCTMDVPMLDENEFSVVQEAFRAAFSHAEGVGGGERNAVSVGIDDQFAPVLAAYCRLGMRGLFQASPLSGGQGLCGVRGASQDQCACTLTCVAAVRAAIDGTRSARSLIDCPAAELGRYAATGCNEMYDD